MSVKTEFQQLRLASPTTLSLLYTLPSGQCFRWKNVSENTWRGVMGSNIITLRQHDPSLLEWTSFPELDTADFALTLNDYFRLNSIDLDSSFTNWSTPKVKSATGTDINVDFAKVGALRQGLRLIRQKPLECAFSFICSQNNNIKRISGMIDRFCTVRLDEPFPVFNLLPPPLTNLCCHRNTERRLLRSKANPTTRSLPWIN